MDAVDCFLRGTRHLVTMSDAFETLDHELLAEFCRKHGISRLALFGSATRG